MLKSHVDHQEVFRKIWIIITSCAKTTKMANVMIVQLLRPLMSLWQNNLMPAISNLVPESQPEARIMRIHIAIIKIMRNHQSAFMLMEIIIITNGSKNKFLKIIDHLRINGRFQQSSAWLKPFQTATEAKWLLSSNNSINNLVKFNTQFLTTLLNNMDSLSNIISNIILIIKLIQVWDSNKWSSWVKCQIIKTINLLKTFTMQSSRSNNPLKREVTHINKRCSRKTAMSALIHTGTRKKSLIKLRTSNNFSKLLITMIYLLVMIMKTKEELKDKEIDQDISQALLKDLNILVKWAMVAITIITHKSQLHQ